MAAWSGQGIEVSPPTWRDRDAPAAPFLTSRDLVSSPDSLGVRLRKDTREGKLVIFDGGWADLSFVDGASGTTLVEAPDLSDLEDVSRLLDRFGTLFL